VRIVANGLGLDSMSSVAHVTEPWTPQLVNCLLAWGAESCQEFFRNGGRAKWMEIGGKGDTLRHDLEV